MTSKNPISDTESLINNLNFESEIDKQFFKRVYSTPKNIYKDRLSLIGFEKKEKILDAGCGFGQWTRVLSELNENIYAVDSEHYRVNIAKQILKINNRENVSFHVGSIESLPFDDDIFDAIISYSVIYWTDFKKSLKEFYRVLKPNGVVYFVANESGWYLYNLVTGHSSASDYNARIYAIQTFFSTIKYFITGKKSKNSSLILSRRSLSKFMKSIGFRKIICAEEGHIQIKKNVELHPFYPKKFLGLANVFEIWAEK